MSALTDPNSFGFDVMVEAQRGMTDAEATRFLQTGELPDLSQLPIEPEEPEPATLTEDEALRFLAGEPLVAAAGFSVPSSLHYDPSTDGETFLFGRGKKKFDPSTHPRDEDGRWAKTSTPRVDVTPEVRRETLVRMRGAARGAAARAAVPKISGRAIREFQVDPANEEINFGLRTGNGVPKKWQGVADELDAALEESRTDRDIVVQRGTTNPRDLFGDAWSDFGTNDGLVWEDAGFTSSTLSPDMADWFARARPGQTSLIMNILIPEGTSAVYLDEDSRLDEVLLPRGGRYRVVDTGFKPYGGEPWEIQVEWLPPDGDVTAAAQDEIDPDDESTRGTPNADRVGWDRFVDTGPRVKILRRSNDDNDSASTTEVADTTAAVTFKFDPRQPRDGDGRWVETPGGDVDLSKVTAPAGKKVVPAIIYKKHSDGTVVAQRGNRRLRWDAGAKKFTVEERGENGGWTEKDRLTKSAAYTAMKQGTWTEPGEESSPTSTEDDGEPTTAPSSPGLDALRRDPAVRAALADKNAFMATHGFGGVPNDIVLEALAEQVNFTGKPDVRGASDVDSLVNGGSPELLKAFREPAHRDNFTDGAYYAGVGDQGNGSYFHYRAADFDPYQAAKVDTYGTVEAQLPDEQLAAEYDETLDKVRTRLRKRAVVIHNRLLEHTNSYGEFTVRGALQTDVDVKSLNDDILPAQAAYLQQLRDERSTVTDEVELAELDRWIQAMQDPGRFATASGVRAYYGTTPNELVVLDRGALVLQDDEPQPVTLDDLFPSNAAPASATVPQVVQSNVEKLRSAYNTGFTVDDQLHGGNSTEFVQVLTLSDGTRAVRKKSKPQDLYADDAQSEYLSGLVADALGIPNTATAQLDDRTTLAPFIEGESGGKNLRDKLNQTKTMKQYYEVEQEHATLPNGKEIGMLDWLINNPDRHNLNWVVTPSGQVQPIDHGNAQFVSTISVDSKGVDKEQAPVGPFVTHWLGLRTTQFNEIRSIKPKFTKAEVADYRSRLEPLEPLFASAGRSDLFDAMMKRLDRVDEKVKK